MKKTIFATVLVCVLSACNDEQKKKEIFPEGNSSVTIEVKQPASTKSVGDQKGDTEYAVLGSAKLYFLDNSYTSIFQRILTTTEVATLANSTSTPTSGNTVTITGIPSSSKYLYFMANIKTDPSQSYPAVEGTGSSDARLRLDRLQGAAQNVPMSGLSPAFTQIADNNYSASVSISPILARIEIGKVTCKNITPGSPISSDITGYKLSGVFINNLYQYVLLDGKPYSSSLVNITNQASWDTNWSTYFTNNVNFPHFTGGSPASPSDWTANAFVNYCTPTASGMIFYPDPTNGSSITNPGTTPLKAWTYQVSPSSQATTSTPVADMPHIILKLTDVTYVDNPLGPKTLFVVVSKYKMQGTSNNVLDFKRGNIYRIDDLSFDVTQATEKPYDKNISVTCSVTVNNWVINSIVPVW